MPNRGLRPQQNAHLSSERHRPPSLKCRPDHSPTGRRRLARSPFLPGEHLLCPATRARAHCSRGSISALSRSIRCGAALRYVGNTALPNSAGPSIFKLWGSTFVVFRRYWHARRFLPDSRIRRGMLYGGKQRAHRNRTSTTVWQIHRARTAAHPDAMLTENAGGRGIIRSRVTIGPGGRNDWSLWSSAHEPTRQFLAIKIARCVSDLIERETASRG